MTPNPCKHCHLTPALHPADVISDGMCYYYGCKCGATGPWRRTRDEAAKMWNEWHGAAKVQQTRAMSVLARRKEVMGC
jgi:hypothetical protein